MQEQKREATLIGQETEQAQYQLMRMLKVMDIVEGEQPLTREQQIETTVVRDRADSFGRKGEGGPTSGLPPPLLTQTYGQWAKSDGLLEVIQTEIYLILNSFFCVLQSSIYW